MKTLAKAGLGLIAVLEAIRKVISPISNRVLDALTGERVTAAKADAAGMASFEADANAVMSAQHTHRAQGLVRAALFIVAALLLWASFAQVDEVTKGDAKVVPSKQLQVIQSYDGGVVTEILVKEGQVVEAGQVLLKVDETRATSGVRESAAQTFSLKAKLARLKALAEGTSFAPPPPVHPEDQNVIDQERQLYESRQSELSEVRSKRESAARSLELSQQELSKTRPLLATGAVSEVEVLRLERDVSRSRGDLEQAGAQSARVQAAISEATRKIQETELAFRNDARKELSETLGRLNSLNEGAVALVDKVSRSQVRSPVRGRVQRLLANTVGGVVAPGKDIVEIVPLDDALVLEAKVQPRDIAFIHPGQQATVKFTAYDFSVYGGLDAVVENISPDTQTDERGQNTYYLVRVRTARANFSEKMPIIPGMTAEVDVLTGKKTVMSYLLKPVLKAKAYALRER
jgi:adhesin transport system membrane fusion protein